MDLTQDQRSDTTCTFSTNEIKSRSRRRNRDCNSFETSRKKRKVNNNAGKQAFVLWTGVPAPDKQFEMNASSFVTVFQQSAPQPIPILVDEGQMSRLKSDSSQIKQSPTSSSTSTGSRYRSTALNGPREERSLSLEVDGIEELLPVYSMPLLGDTNLKVRCESL